MSGGCLQILRVAQDDTRGLQMKNVITEVHFIPLVFKQYEVLPM